MRVLLLTCFLVSSASAQIRPLPDSIFSTPANLLIDYIDLTGRVVPALQAAIVEYRFAVYQDSIIIARQQQQIAMMERQLEDSERKGELFKAEIERRKEAEGLWAGEVRRLRRWRWASVAAGVIGLTIAVVK